VNLPLVFNGDRPRSVISSTIDCPYGAYTIHRDGEPEFWTTFTDLDGNTVSGSVAAAADELSQPGHLVAIASVFVHRPVRVTPTAASGSIHQSSRSPAANGSRTASLRSLIPCSGDAVHRAAGR